MKNRDKPEKTPYTWEKFLISREKEGKKIKNVKSRKNNITYVTISWINDASH